MSIYVGLIYEDQALAQVNKIFAGDDYRFVAHKEWNQVKNINTDFFYGEGPMVSPSTVITILCHFVRGPDE